MIQGIDFDNTIVCYDTLMHRVAVERGLVDAKTPPNKKAVRDAIRLLPEGDVEWQKVQGQVYGRRIVEASPFPGVLDFFRDLAGRCQLFIVSHKTNRPHFDETGPNLREAALSWLKAHHFFDADGGCLSPQQVFFEGTREGKIRKIRELGCTCFIDDLEETFQEPDFPKNVRRILFDPAKESSQSVADLTLSDWKSIRQDVEKQLSNTSDVALLNDLSALLRSPVKTFRRIGGGGNSQVYGLDLPDGKRVAVKHYFRRDRLAAEQTALQFLWSHNIQDIPEPLAISETAGLLAIRFIEGTPLTAESVTESDVDQLADFLLRLEKLKTVPEAVALPNASEACFSLAAIETNLSRRFDKLLAVEATDTLATEMREFLKKEVLPWRESCSEKARTQLQREGKTPETEIPREERTLSPSDFGFHNTLRQNDGRLIFLDFEHFGWCDPAKAISDFLFHPHPCMTIKEGLKKRWAVRLLKGNPNPSRLKGRLNQVAPFYGLKWCAILLNEFIPSNLERRAFAGGGGIEKRDLQTRQLAKARAMFGKAKTIHDFIAEL